MRGGTRLRRAGCSGLARQSACAASSVVPQVRPDVPKSRWPYGWWLGRYVGDRIFQELNNEAICRCTRRIRAMGLRGWRCCRRIGSCELAGHVPRATVADGLHELPARG